MLCCGDDGPLEIFAPRPLFVSKALSRAHLRDSRRRLVAIRAACGFLDKDAAEGDKSDAEVEPIVRLARDFETHVEQLRAVAGDAVGDLQERVSVRRDLQGAQVALDAMRELVERAEAQLNSAELRKKAEATIERLRDVLDTHRVTYERCSLCMEEVKRLTQGMTWSAKSRLPRSEAYQRAVRLLAQKGGIDVDAGASAGGFDDVDMSELAQQSGLTLEAANETRDQMRLVEQQKAKVRTALDRILASVQTVRETAVQLRNETATQVARLEDLDESMRLQVENIRDGNARIARLNESMRPFNVCVNCTMVIIVLGAAGFLLYRFGVVGFSV
jgi:hypothetical protein